MSDPSGRYAARPTHQRELAGLGRVQLREPRLPPPPPDPARPDRRRVRVGRGARLDHLAAEHLGDAYAWWRFADAHPGVPIDELDRPGQVLDVPDQRVGRA